MAEVKKDVVGRGEAGEAFAPARRCVTTGDGVITGTTRDDVRKSIGDILGIKPRWWQSPYR